MGNKIKKITVITSIAFLLSFIMNVSLSYAAESNRVIDEADIIGTSEETKLGSKIKDIQKDNFDVVILTVNSLGSKSAQDYADDYYDYNNYGFDSEQSGVLFLISKGDRKYHISTKGAGIKAFTDYGIDRVKDEIKPYLSDGKYFEACDEFLTITKDFLAAYKDGKPYDTNNLYNEEIDYVVLEIIALVISFVIALISVGVMKWRMNTARPKGYAGEYVKNDSFKLMQEKDIFMYSNVHKTVREIESSGGGSSTHTSSSGSTHGGGGGSF